MSGEKSLTYKYEKLRIDALAETMYNNLA